MYVVTSDEFSFCKEDSETIDMYFLFVKKSCPCGIILVCLSIGKLRRELASTYNFRGKSFVKWKKNCKFFDTIYKTIHVHIYLCETEQSILFHLIDVSLKFKHDIEKSIFIHYYEISKFEKLWYLWDHIFDFWLSKICFCFLCNFLVLLFI